MKSVIRAFWAMMFFMFVFVVIAQAFMHYARSAGEQDIDRTQSPFIAGLRGRDAWSDAPCTASNACDGNAAHADALRGASVSSQ